jgi:hypothetical protein
VMQAALAKTSTHIRSLTVHANGIHQRSQRTIG